MSKKVAYAPAYVIFLICFRPSHKWVPAEFTFALTCKQQIITETTQIIQVYLIFFNNYLHI